MARKDSESSDSGSDTSSGSEAELTTIASDQVVTFYKKAAEVVNEVLKEVLKNVKEGIEIGTLCDLGDKLITDKLSQVFKKDKGTEKGIAMPTCVSVDNCICHFSPLRSDPPVTLKEGQVVKIDLGAHVHGFIATAAHTVVVGASKDKKVSGNKANVIKAAYDAMEVAIRLLRPGKKNFDLTDAIDKVAAEYKVTPVENMVSHSLEKNQIDGSKQIIQNPGEKQRKDIEKQDIEVNEVYAIDVLLTTGQGKARDMDTRTTVFKKEEDASYNLRMKASRAFISQVIAKHGSMPFTLRAFEDEVKAKMGVVECEKHALVRPYQVLYEKDEAVVAQFKTTVLVTANGISKITGLPLDETVLETSEKLTDEELVKTLATALKPKKKNNKKKAAAAKPEGEAAAPAPAAPAAASK